MSNIPPPDSSAVRHQLRLVAENITSYGDGELLAIKNSCDVLSFAIRKIRDEQASRMVDAACRLEVA
jgi:hypothetical protein